MNSILKRNSWENLRETTDILLEGTNYAFLQRECFGLLEKDCQRRKMNKVQYFSDLMNEIFPKEDDGNQYKTYQRIENRLLESGKERAGDKTCIHFIRALEKEYRVSLLLETETDRSNYYLHTQVLTLLSAMAASDYYNYVPGTRFVGYACHQNTLEAILQNVRELYQADYPELCAKWLEVLEPFERMIKDGDFPGLREGIWLDAAPELAYFDAAYRLAEKGYEMYRRGRNQCAVPLGDDEQSIQESVARKKEFFRENGLLECDTNDKWWECFSKHFENAYRKIIWKYFRLR